MVKYLQKAYLVDLRARPDEETPGNAIQAQPQGLHVVLHLKGFLYLPPLHQHLQTESYMVKNWNSLKI
jgi:hypothetical protein